MKFPETIKGAIFDVDDTILDNQAGVEFGTIHEHSRREAIHHVAEKYNLPNLASVTAQENLDAFHNATTHSLDGAVWEVLYLKKIIDSKELDPDNELLKEIVLLKNELHIDSLRTLGREVMNASVFVDVLASQFRIEGKMAIASSAIRRDINIFLDELTSLRRYFPDERIVSYEDIPHGLGKPHPEPFNRAFATLGLLDSDRPSVVAFEDDPRGIISAKKAGLFVCAITTRFAKDHPQLVAAEPDMIIESYADAMEELGSK
jgi:beta-phosphoglucomutase-like phosphatase (HAD superfamily)